MIFIDASYFIAVVNKKDQWHQRSIKIHQKTEKQEQITSISTLTEALNVIGSLKGGKKAKMLYNYIHQTNEIIYPHENMILNASDKFLMYDGTLSFVDAISLQIMETHKINTIISFDSDFDKVKGITRIH